MATKSKQQSAQTVASVATSTAFGPQDLPVLRMDQPLLAARGSDEWLLTNGLGGFAFGTASSVPQRRYHGWLVAATQPPGGRFVALSSCADALVVQKGRKSTAQRSNKQPTDHSLLRFDLASFHFADPTNPVVSPAGTSRLVRFERGPSSVSWTYEVRDEAANLSAKVTRRLHMHRGSNAITIAYDIESTPEWDCYLECRPLVAMRDFHELVEHDDSSRYQVFDAHSPGTTNDSSQQQGVRVVANGVVLEMTLRDRAPVSFSAQPRGRFSQNIGGQWWYNFVYQRDFARGQSHREHLFSPGCFVVPLRTNEPQQRVEIVARVGGAAGVGDSDESQRGQALARSDCFDELAKSEGQRLASLAGHVVKSCTALDTKSKDTLAKLVVASDTFVVRRSGAIGAAAGEGSLSSVIAGYPWFGDWGRDTFVSLPGLMLTTGRFTEALDTLRAFASMRRRGLIPNCFDNAAGSAEYNTVDASLWFILACCRYTKASGDTPCFETHLRQACLDIIEAYQKGTDFGIRVDPKDGLVTAGDATTQLTWMDARRDGVVFTPRSGKPVEVNALWYAALLMLADVLEAKHPRTAREIRQHANVCGSHFEAAYWHSAHACLHDVAYANSFEMRPNQIFAAALEYSPLPVPKRRAIVEAVRHFLIVPEGVRTLAPGSNQYQPRYEGSLFDRDGAYHNGTVWPWLLGAFCDATMRNDGHSEASRKQARAMLEGAMRTLSIPTEPAAPIQPIGNIAEIYDADDRSASQGVAGARRPEGCPMQAWSVAELLRVYAATFAESAG
ncbi:MAG: amylo-alpha-1,6-glucosidase [Phycisphaerales bacterium]